MLRLEHGDLARRLAVGVASLAVATVVVGLLEQVSTLANASSVYLVAVVVTALAAGTAGAVASAVAAILLYDFLFTQPVFTLTISDPGEWLSVALLLFVGIVVGQLTALQRARADVALAREREAVALFRISRAMATRDSAMAVLPEIASILRTEARLDRTWISLGRDDTRERAAADTGSGDRPGPASLHQTLRRTPGDAPAVWVRVHPGTHVRPRPSAGIEAFRVRIEAGGATFGSIWSLRDPRRGLPDATETRLISAAADQVGQALAHDRLADEARAAEIARQSDELKSALLQSVSHDLRTPLATIRAAAGTLRPGQGLSAEDQLESAEAIDREVEYLNRLVTNLLDLSRIEAGALRADLDAFELDDLVRQTVDRLASRLAGRQIEVSLDAPPVMVDPVLLDEAVTNILENAAKYAPKPAPIRISARELPGGPVQLTIEDGGPGVPEEALPRVFEKFYRVPGAARGSRSGTGIGLAVVRGLIEAMGGTVSARASEMGGLAIDIVLNGVSLRATVETPAEAAS